MGRTLNYEIKRDKGNFTRKELEAMYRISKRYNSPEMLADINSFYKTKLKELWTCENFWLGVGNFYPNWELPTFAKIRNTPNINSTEVIWGMVNKTIEDFEKETGSFIDAVEKAVKMKIINLFDEDKNKFHNFTKVQGNEFNSLLVFKALVEISKKIPAATLTLTDEGEFLLCDLTIKNGKVLPNIKETIDDMKYYALKSMFSKKYEKNILASLKHTEFKSESFKNDLGLENTYGDMTKYIDEKLRNLQEVESAILKHWKENVPIYLYNLENLPVNKWFPPEAFVRPVDVNKFINYKMNAGTLMDGFSGEGFGLTDKDAEAESYKMIGHMFSMLEKMGIDTKNGKILGAD